MEQRAPGHAVLDDKIYTKGFLDFKKYIQKTLKTIDYYNDTEAYKKQEQLNAMLICCDSLITFANRYADKALKLAKSEEDEQRKRELLEIANVCKHVPSNPPRSFREALQMYWFVHLGVIIELNTWDAFLSRSIRSTFISIL